MKGPIVMLIVAMVGLFQPLSPSTPITEPEPTGSITILVQAEDGSAVGGSCFSLISESGNPTDFCDNQATGTIQLQQIPTGAYTLRNTSVVEGYLLADDQALTVETDLETTVTVIHPLAAVEPSPTPTTEPSPTPATATPQPTKEIPAPSEAERLAAAQVAEDLSPSVPIIIDCSYDPTTLTSDFRVKLYKYSADAPTTNDPGLTVTVSPVDREFNDVTPIVYNDYDSVTRFVDQPWRRIDVTVTWPNGMTGTAFADCDSTLYQPQITTQVMTAEDEAVPDGGVVPSGSTIYDTAIFQGQGPNTTGSVTYRLYAGDSCTGEPVFTSTVNVAADGIIPPSEQHTFSADATGTYNWQVTYSGDKFSLGSQSECGLESVIVGELPDTIRTFMFSSPNESTNTSIPQNGTIQAGLWVSDTAQIIDLNPGATGSVSFSLYNNLTCQGTPVYTNQVELTSGATTADSGQYLPTALGAYSWVVTYSGDLSTNTPPSQSSCGREVFNVAKADTAVSTSMSAMTNGPSDQNILFLNNNSTLPAGYKLRDSGSVSLPNGGYSSVDGNLRFQLYYNPGATANCTVGELVYDETVPFPANSTTNSQISTIGDGYLLDRIGTYDWVVTYSGSDTLNTSVSSCGQERITTQTVSLTSTTEMFSTDAAGNDTPLPPLSETAAPFWGGDRLTLTPTNYGNTLFIKPLGTVRYELFSSANCDAGSRVFFQDVTVAADGTIPEARISQAQALLVPGAYNWKVTYTPSAGSPFLASTSDCPNEQFYVNSLTGAWSITTEPHAVLAGQDKVIPWNGLVPYGAQVYDTAQITGTPPSTEGTMVFRLYLGSACTSGATFTSADQPVTGGTVGAWVGPRYTVATTGAYYWQATFYGPGNIELGKSLCERERFRHVTLSSQPLISTVMHTVEGGQDRVVNQYGNASPGSVVYDTVNFSTGQYSDWTGVQPQGTLTYRLYFSSDATCGGSPVFTSTVPIAAGQPLPPSGQYTLPSTIGYYNWRVQYTPPAGGDNNFTGYTTGCQTELFATRGNTTITTVMLNPDNSVLPNNSEIDVLQPVLDTAQLTWPSGSVTPRGWVYFYLYAGPDCQGSVVQVVAGQIDAQGRVRANSPFIVAGVGQYSIQANYGGDNSYGQSQSVCGTENFRVVGEPRIATEMRTPFGVVPQNGQINLGTQITDNATMSGYQMPAEGTVTFELFHSADCSAGTSVYSKLIQVTPSSPLYPGSLFSDAYEPTELGIYNWVVTYDPTDPDEANIVSPCGAETFEVVEKFDQAIQVYCSYDSVLDRSSYRVVLSKPFADTPDEDPYLFVLIAPFDRDGNLLADQIIQYNKYDSDLGGPPPDLENKDWGYIRVITYNMYSSFVPKYAAGGCAAVRATTTLTTEMTTLTATGTQPLPHQGEVWIDNQVQDLAVFPEDRTPQSGTVTYTLYKDDATCSPASQVGEPQVVDIIDGVVPPSTPVDIDEGIYYWVVNFSGDGEFAPAVSPCGAEVFAAVPKVTTTLTTAMSTVSDAGTSPLPHNGTAWTGDQVQDQAVFPETGTPASGSLTYELYKDDPTCAPESIVGAPTVVDIVDGVIPPSAPVDITPGTYYWVVSYSGNDEYNPAVSPCGAEIFTAALREPVLTTAMSTVNEDGSAPLPHNGTTLIGSQVQDLAVFEAGSIPQSGTITYTLYKDDATCGEASMVGQPEVLQIIEGAIPQSSPVTVEEGTYYYVVTFSGNDEYEPAVSECGAEVFAATEVVPTPTVAPSPTSTVPPTGTPVPSPTVDPSPTSTVPPIGTPAPSPTVDPSPTSTVPSNGTPISSPTGAPDGTPVVSLPNTGQGTSGADSLSTALVLLASVIALVATGTAIGATRKPR